MSEAKYKVGEVMAKQKRVPAEQKRIFLKSRGWRRYDRAEGDYWLHPRGLSFANAVTLAWAYKKEIDRERKAVADAR